MPERKQETESPQNAGFFVGESFSRDFKIETKSTDEGARTVEIAFSSEEPYERVFGVEVLDHQPQSVRLDRLNGGAAVLVNHDSSDQVGVVESARIDSDGKGRAVIRFSKSNRGQEIYQDVQDGIRSLVSVGYRIHKYEVTERDGSADLVRVTDWEPYEVSLVAIPADATVGVGRSDTEKPIETKAHAKETPTMSEKEKAVEQEPAKPAFDVEAEKTRLRTEETRRVDAIRAIADKYDVEELSRQAVSEGWTVPEFNEKALEVIGERNNKARRETKHDGDVDLSAQERKQFSMVRLMDALANPKDRAAQDRAGLELEVSAEARRGFGSEFKCRGEFVPPSLLGFGTRALDTTATDGAELIATDLIGSEYIKVLRNASATLGAGVRMVPGLVGDVQFPRQTSGASSTWLTAEDAEATESEPQFDQVSLTPKDLACYTEVTRRLLQQSTPAVDGIVVEDLVIAQALGIDLAVLHGTGSNGQPTGIASTSGINTVDLAAADPTYAEIVQIIKEVMADNALPMNTATVRWIIEANGWEALSTTPKQGSGVEGNFILGENERIKGYPYTMSNQVTDEQYFFGDWSQVLVGEWGGLEVNVDPYTHSLRGRIRFVTFKTVDVAVRQPTAFCHAHDGIV
jgi:HK97 family phage major capsid protein/HK97 family phage prohead protease